MNAWRRGLIACAALAACSPAAPPVAAGDEILTELKWLSVDADRVEHLSTFVPEPVTAGAVGTYEFELGRLAFRSPGLLGGIAAREGLTCQTCHVNGRSNPNFFLAGLSSNPGTVDTTSAVFSEVLGDSTFNPIDIPTLEGVTESAPYGHDSREPSLAAFTHTVIVDEFAGREPSQAIFDAVITYISALKQQDPRPRESITLAQELSDLERGLNVLEHALERDDREVATFVIFAMRSQLGRINERFASLDDAQDVIQQWSQALRVIRDDIEEGRLVEAKEAQVHWYLQFAPQQSRLMEREADSLYNAQMLRRAITKFDTN